MSYNGYSERAKTSDGRERMKTIPQLNTTSWFLKKGTEMLELTITHECDESAQHRLVINGRVGYWVLWGEVAYFDYEKERFAAVTECFWPTLPEIFKVVKVRDHDPLISQEERWELDDNQEEREP
jgi:hypothetical protein